MSEHKLKTWPEYFAAVLDGTKTFELRRDDRPFAVGDTLLLQEWDPPSGEYTGRECRRVVTYALRDADWLGLKDGFVILGLESGERSSRQAWATKAVSDENDYRELLGSIWLYVNWRYVTSQLTTEQKELWADAVDASGDPDIRGPKADRWWTKPPCTCGHEASRHLALSVDPPPGCMDCGCQWFSADRPAESVRVCACPPADKAAEQAAAIQAAGPLWSLPQCAIHGGGE